MRALSRVLFLLALAACGGLAAETATNDGGVPPGSAPVDSGALVDARVEVRPNPATDAGTDAGPSRCVDATSHVCEAPKHVATIADVVAAANGVDWQSPYFGGKPLLSSPDLIADATLTAFAKDFVPPDTCTAAMQCDAQIKPVAYPHYSAIAGVTCSSPPTCAVCDCASVIITKGTTFRVRRIAQYHLPGSDMTRMIEIVEPCSTTCATGQLFCPATTTCLARGEEWCKLCDGLDINVCACRNEDCTPKPAGAECTYSGGDYIHPGKCTAGSCN